MDKWQSTPVAHSNALSKAAGSHGRSDRRRPDPRVGSGREPPAGAGCDADGEHPAGTRLCRAGSGRRRPSGQADHRRSTGQRHILGAFVRSCAHTSRRLPSACPDLLRTPRGRGPAANRPVICPPPDRAYAKERRQPAAWATLRPTSGARTPGAARRSGQAKAAGLGFRVHCADPPALPASDSDGFASDRRPLPASESRTPTRGARFQTEPLPPAESLDRTGPAGSFRRVGLLHPDLRPLGSTNSVMTPIRDIVLGSTTTR